MDNLFLYESVQSLFKDKITYSVFESDYEYVKMIVSACFYPLIENINNFEIRTTEEVNFDPHDALIFCTKFEPNKFMQSDEFCRLSGIEAFIKSKHREPIKVYMMDHRKACVVVDEGLAIFKSIVRYMDFIPQLCRFFFEKLNKETKEAISKFQKMINSGDEVHALNYLANYYNVSKICKAEMLNKIVSDYAKSKRKVIMEEIHTCDVRMSQLMDEIARQKKCMNELLEFNPPNTDMSEFIEYVSQNENIILNIEDLNTNMENFYFTLKTDLTNWEPDVYYSVREDAIAIKRGLVTKDLTNEQFGHVLDQIFDQKTYIIQTSGSFMFSIPSMAIRAAKFIKTEDGNRITNPHIFHYGCMGGFTDFVAKKVKENCLIEAIEGCFAATANINPAEFHPTFRTFLNDIFGKHYEQNFLRCKETGVLVSPKYLVEMETMNETSEN